MLLISHALTSYLAISTCHLLNKIPYLFCVGSKSADLQQICRHNHETLRTVCIYGSVNGIADGERTENSEIRTPLLRLPYTLGAVNIWRLSAEKSTEATHAVWRWHVISADVGRRIDYFEQLSYENVTFSRVTSRWLTAQCSIPLLSRTLHHQVGVKCRYHSRQ